MDLDMVALLETVAETITAAPVSDASADYLHRCAMICADALREIAGGEHPGEVLAVMEDRLDVAVRPTSSVPVWGPAGTFV